MVLALNVLESFLEACSLDSIRWVVLYALGRLIFLLFVVFFPFSRYLKFLLLLFSNSNLLCKGLTYILDYFSIHSIQNACLSYLNFTTTYPLSPNLVPTQLDLTKTNFTRSQPSLTRAYLYWLGFGFGLSKCFSCLERFVRKYFVREKTNTHNID